jgi:hypothetical protein
MNSSFPYHPTNATYANQIDLSGVAVTDTRVVLEVPLPIGQPYTLNIAEVSTGSPVTGPSSCELTLTATGSYGTGETVEFTVGRRGSYVIQNTGPFRLSARPLQAAVTLGPVLSCWVSIEPTVPVSWPILSDTQTVGAAFGIVNINNGHPAPYRSNLTLQTDGNINVRFVDLLGNTVADYAGLTPIQCGELFSAKPIDPQLRLSVQQGAAPPANNLSISWSD